MPISIEFQIAGLVFSIILCIAFFKKVKWDSPQNRIYKALLIATIVNLVFDIASVYTINHRDSIPLVNAIFSKLYIVSMNSFIFIIDLYALSCATNRKLSPLAKKLKTTVIAALAAMLVTIFVLVGLNNLYYSGYGREIYSYGIPSDLTYMFSTFSVAYVVFVLLLNIRYIPLSKLFSILSFCVMEGTIAIVQMFNKELLLVGFGTSVTVFIMYFTVENPDSQTISRLSQANKRARELIRYYSTAMGSRKSADLTSSKSALFSEASIMHLDIVDFAKFANRMGIERLSRYLSSFYEKIESAADGFRVEKIRAFGSSYTVVSGVPNESSSSAIEMVHFALEILNILRKTNAQNGMNLQLKIGIASGPVIADIAGSQNFILNIWGVPIVLAEALQRTSAPNAIHVSESVYAQLSEIYNFTELEQIECPGVGKVNSWQLEDNGGGQKHSLN